MTTTHPDTTHEEFIQSVRSLVLAHAELSDEERVQLTHTKLVYGVGNPAVRGVCIYKVWQNGVGNVDVVEISAFAQESYVQLAGTVVHELGHVIAGPKAGHGKDWKDTARRLGFTKRPEAAGQVYRLAMFRRELREAVADLAQRISDGRPDFWGALGLVPVRPRPCSAGIGSRGGRSRGKGSGSRLRLWECACAKPIKIRVASDDIDVTCNRCEAYFEMKRS